MKKRFIIILLIPTILGLLLGLYFDFFAANANKNLISTFIFLVAGFIVGLVAALAGAAGGAIGNKVDKEVFAKSSPTKSKHINQKISVIPSNPIQTSSPYSYFSSLKDSLKILIFNENALKNVTDNKKATLYGILTIFIVGIATSISTLKPTLIILNSVGMIVFFFISYSIYHFIAKFIFGGQATGIQYFRAISSIFVIYWLAFIPSNIITGIVMVLGGLWLLVANVFILHKTHKLSTFKSIILGLLPLILLIFLIILFGIALFSSFA